MALAWDGFSGWTDQGASNLTSSHPDSPLFREESLFLVKADSLGPCRAALPGTQPRRAGGTEKPHQNHRAGQAPESAPTSNLSPMWPHRLGTEPTCQAMRQSGLWSLPRKRGWSQGRRRDQGLRAMPGKARGFPSFTLGGPMAGLWHSHITLPLLPIISGERYGGALHRGVPGLCTPSEGNWLTK